MLSGGDKEEAEWKEGKDEGQGAEGREEGSVECWLACRPEARDRDALRKGSPEAPGGPSLRGVSIGPPSMN